MIPLRVYYFMFFCFLFQKAYSYQVPNNFVKLNTEHGLSNSIVTAVEQDNLGQLWIGTRCGLNKFDGDDITIFKVESDKESSLISNDITEIKQDRRGYLWIGTNTGLNKYDPKSKSFKKYFLLNSKNNSTPLIIKSVFELKNGDLWLGTSKGVFVYDSHADKFDILKTKSVLKSDLPNTTVSSFFENSKSIWIGTNQGLYKFDKETKELQYFAITKELNIQDIEIHTSSELWLATKRNGLKLFDKEENQLVFSKLASQVKSKDIRKLSYDSDRNLWIGTFDGLYVFNRYNQVQKITQEKGNRESLRKNSIKEIYTGKKGEVVVGTYYGGVNILDNNSSFKKVYYEESGLFKRLTLCNSMVKDEKGNFYFVSKGIKVFDKEKIFNKELSKKLSLDFSSKQIKRIKIFNSKLWISTLKNGFFCFDLNSEKFVKNDLINRINEKLDGTGVYDLVKHNDFLFLGSFGKGLLIYDLNTKKLVKHLVNDVFNDKNITHNQVRNLLLDTTKDNLWIGTEKGITRLHLNSYSNFSNPKVSFYLNANVTELPKKITSIFETNKGEVIAGSYEKGLFVFKNETFNSLPNNQAESKFSTVYSILGQVNNSIFFTSCLGVASYNLKTKRIGYHNEIKTFKGNDFLIGTQLTDSDGCFYFSTVNNVICFNPKKLKKEERNSEIILTNLLINQKDSHKNLSYINKINLNPEEHFFTIQFANPNFNHLQKNTYIYRLKGLNKDWIYTKDNEASFILQEAGNYIFEVKLANIKDSKVKQIPIIFKAPWWKTNWAYGLYLSLIIFGGYIYGINYKNNLKLKFKLAKQEFENQNQETLNKNKIEFFTNISHDLRTPLSLILLPLQQILKDYNGKVETFKKLKVIEGNANQLLKLSNEVLFFRSLEERKRFKIREENLISLVENVYKSFQDFAILKNIDFSFTSSTDCVNVYCNKLSLERVFYNLISNAFKHSPKNGKVKIEVRENKDNIAVKIFNFQKSPLNENEISNIFNNFYTKLDTNNPHQDFNSGFGIGLFIAKKIVDLHKGNIVVNNESFEEIIFEVEIKKGKSHFDEEILFEENKTNSKSDICYQYDVFNEQKLNIKKIDNLKFDKNKRTVLIVEDNTEFRDFLVDNFKNKYNIKIAEDGKEGYKKIIEHHIDLVISDIKIPLMDGIDLCKKIKHNENTNHIPVILLTSLSSDVDRFNGLLVGADGYFTKPFNISEFNLLISNLIKTKVNAISKISNENDIQIESNSYVSKEDDLINKAHFIIEKHIEDYNFNVALFANELGLSRTMLFAKIKEYTNQTPKEFITCKRMKRAAKLIENKDFTIAEVAYKVGYKDCKHFSKVFKQHHELSPSVYREKFFTECLK